VQFEQLQQAFATAKGDDAIVWYYREAAGKTPPPRALEVLNLVVQNQLRISLSSRPDFSDYVDAHGVSHPRAAPAAAAEPRIAATTVATAEDGLGMPEVEEPSDLDDIFARARRAAAGDRRTALVIVRPDRKHMVMPAMSETPALKHAVLALRRLVPSDVKRSIAVIANTVFPGAGEPGVNEVNRSIPFVGMLMGLTRRRRLDRRQRHVAPSLRWMAGDRIGGDAQSQHSGARPRNVPTAHSAEIWRADGRARLRQLGRKIAKGVRLQKVILARLVAFTAFSLSAAYGCTCKGTRTVNVAKDQSTVLFRGRIIGVRPARKHVVFRSIGGNVSIHDVAVFRVSRVWKGEVGPTSEDFAELGPGRAPGTPPPQSKSK